MRTKKKEEFEETSNKSTKKQGRILTGGGGQFFWLARNPKLVFSLCLTFGRGKPQTLEWLREPINVVNKVL